MRQTRHILAAVVVASALCADQAAAAVPAARGPVVSFTQRITQRLSVRFVREQPALALAERRAERPERVVVAALVPVETPPVRVRLTPFQFRLPPPTA